MSRRPRRKFETGFKKQLVSQIVSGQITSTSAARTHSISPTVIAYWRKQFQAGELSEGPTGREKALLKEMEQYKKLLAEAHKEINILKKQQELKQRQIKLNTSVITGLDFQTFKNVLSFKSLLRACLAEPPVLLRCPIFLPIRLFSFPYQ